MYIITELVLEVSYYWRHRIVIRWHLSSRLSRSIPVTWDVECEVRIAPLYVFIQYQPPWFFDLLDICVQNASACWTENVICSRGFLFSCSFFILIFSRYSFFLSSYYITNSPFVSRLFLSYFFMFHVFPFFLLSYFYLTNSAFVFVFLVTVLFYFHSSFFMFIPDGRLFNIWSPRTFDPVRKHRYLQSIASSVQSNDIRVEISACVCVCVASTVCFVFSLSSPLVYWYLYSG